jgi:hypothetical protein
MNGGYIGKFIRAFDQYLGAWVGMILASTVLMGWVEKMFVLVRWNPEKEMYVNQPMFPTPDWWTNPLGLIAILVGTCLTKLGVGYWTNSKYNSQLGQPPTVPTSPDPGAQVKTAGG